MGEPEKLIPKHGGYRRLKSFQIAELILDVTVRFCDRYIDKRSRTHTGPKHARTCLGFRSLELGICFGFRV